MFRLFFLCFLLFSSISQKGHAQNLFGKEQIEFSAGVSGLLYQSIYSFQNSTAIEVSGRGQISGSLALQIGMRHGLEHGSSEGFARLLSAHEFKTWLPAVGFEIGITNRARFDDGDKLLRETRQAMEDDISNVYIAVYSAPLSFRVMNEWRLSMLELQVGTHLGNTGRTLRLQMGILSLGRML